MQSVCLNMIKSELELNKRNTVICQHYVDDIEDFDKANEYGDKLNMNIDNYHIYNAVIAIVESAFSLMAIDETGDTLRKYMDAQYGRNMQRDTKPYLFTIYRQSSEHRKANPLGREGSKDEYLHILELLRDFFGNR